MTDFNNTKDEAKKSEKLNAGTYLYEITVNFQDGTSKTARSNEVTLFSKENDINPIPRAAQLLDLTDEGVKALGLEGNYTKENVRLTTLTTDGHHYAVITETSADGKTTVKELIDVTEKAADLVANHPEQYRWTADFLLRALDEDDFRSSVNSQISAGLLPRTMTADKVIAGLKFTARGGSKQSEDFASFTTTDGRAFYGAILNMNDDINSIGVNLNMTYPIAEDKENTTDASFNVMAVMPMPTAISYAYRDSEASGDEGLGADTETPDFFTEGTTSVTLKTLSAVDGSEVEVGFRKEDFRSRTLIVDFTFPQPNASEEVLKAWDIRYDVTLTNTDGTLMQTAVYADGERTLKNRPYKLTVTNVDPSTTNHPILRIDRVNYVQRNAEGSESSVSGTYSYGSLEMEAPVKFEGGDASIAEFGVTVYRSTTDGLYNYFYKSHSELDDAGDQLVGNSTTEDRGYNLQPTFYHMETALLDASGNVVNNSTREQVTLNWNDVFDTYVPFYGTEEQTLTAAQHFSIPVLVSEETLAAQYGLLAPSFERVEDGKTFKVFITPVYVFHRNPTHCADVNASNGLTLYQGTQRAAAQPGVTTSTGEGRNELIVLRGKGTTAVPSDDDLNPTGIDTISADGQGAERYYDLQGNVVTRPEAGRVYIRLENGRATKVMIQ